MYQIKSRLLLSLFVMVTIIFAGLVSAQPVDDTVHIYFGNLDGSPIIANPGRPLIVDCWVKMPPEVFVGGFMITLGTLDHYLSEPALLYCRENYPLNLWFDGRFVTPWFGAPPSDSGWHSQKYVAARWNPVAEPPLHYEVPTEILKFVYIVRDSSSFIGTTVVCFDEGPDSTFLYWQAADTSGTITYPMKAHFSPVSFETASDICDYAYGDVNGSGVFDGADVMYAVRYFKQTGPPPPDSCYNELVNTTNHYLYVALDVSGDCEISGADVTRMVAYLKGLSVVGGCIWFPPGR